MQRHALHASQPALRARSGSSRPSGKLLPGPRSSGGQRVGPVSSSDPSPDQFLGDPFTTAGLRLQALLGETHWCALGFAWACMHDSRTIQGWLGMQAVSSLIVFLSLRRDDGEQIRQELLALPIESRMVAFSNASSLLLLVAFGLNLLVHEDPLGAEALNV